MSNVHKFYQKILKIREHFFSPLAASETIEWAYRLFLDREPENRQVVAKWAKRFSSTQNLRQEFLNSAEFRQKKQGFLHSPALSGNEPAMSIEAMDSETELQVIFQHIQEAWQHLGETEPYWSVVTLEQYKISNIERSKEVFYNSGKAEVERLFKTLERNGLDRSSYRSCLEYGCGLGRIVRWMSEYFEQVYGYDISRSHLRYAEQYLAAQQISNVALHLVEQIEDVGKLPKVDLIFSVIVLQHNPPPVIGYIIRQFLRALNPGGIAYFQVPTYRLGYRFSLSEYLSTDATLLGMEMHVFPQNKIFDLAKEEGGKLIEVVEDQCTGSRHGEMSNTFLIQKG